MTSPSVGVTLNPPTTDLCVNPPPPRAQSSADLEGGTHLPEPESHPSVCCPTPHYSSYRRFTLKSHPFLPSLPQIYEIYPFRLSLKQWERNYCWKKPSCVRNGCSFNTTDSVTLGNSSLPCTDYTGTVSLVSTATVVNASARGLHSR